MRDNPPRQDVVWQSSIAAPIAHAIFVAKFPDFAHEQSWDGTNYSIQDSMGSRGTIAFFGNLFVAVLFDADSSRNPDRSGLLVDPQTLLAGMPSSLLAPVAEEAMQYVLQDVEGKPKPVITAAFWGDGKGVSVSSAEAWTDTYAHGANTTTLKRGPGKPRS